MVFGYISAQRVALLYSFCQVGRFVSIVLACSGDIHDELFIVYELSDRLFLEGALE